MDRRRFLALALTAGGALLLSSGCGGGAKASPTRSSGRVILPAGSPLALDKLRLSSGLNPATLQSGGDFAMEQFGGDAALLVLADADQRPVLMGFSGSAANGMVGEVSPLQTSVAMLFYALGAFTLPAAAQENVRTLLQGDDRVKALASQISTLLAASPYALADGDPTLIAAVAAVRDALVPTRAAVPVRHRSRDTPIAATLIQTTPEERQSGFLAAANADGLGLTITNTLRRNAIVNIYEIGYKDASGAAQTAPDSKFHRVIHEEILWGTSGLAGVAGSLIDYANGTVAYGPVSSGPYSLDLFPAGATKSEYRIEIIANGNGGDPGDLKGTSVTLPGELTPLGASFKMEFITLIKDLVLPAVATFSGLGSALKLDLVTGAGYPSSELLKNFDDLAVILSGVVDSGIAISAENARSLLVAILKALANNGTLRQKFIEWMVLVFAKQGFTAGVAGVLFGTLATAINAVVILVDKLLGGADLGAVLADWARSDSYMLFDAKVISSKVTLKPATATLKAGDLLDLTATTNSDAPLLSYHWSLLSGVGTFRNPTSGFSGDSIDSASAKMQFQSDKDSKDKDEVKVQVEAFNGSVNDPKRESIGKATATVTIQKDEKLIVNGDFSAGLANWSQVRVNGGSFGGYPHFSVSAPWRNAIRANNPACNIDVPGGSAGYIGQTVKLPDRALTLSFVAWNSLQIASLSIRIVSGGTETVLATVTPASIQKSDSEASGVDATAYSYPLDAFKGKTVEVRFQATASGSNGTVIGLDDIDIR